MVSIEKLPRIFQYPGSLLSKMTREAHPIEAAERQLYVAPLGHLIVAEVVA